MLTPMPLVSGSMWNRPPRAARLCVPVTWPSPETRWPTLSPFTLAPSSAITPEYSWPTTSGTGIVRCAHSSQL